MEMDQLNEIYILNDINNTLDINSIISKNKTSDNIKWLYIEGCISFIIESNKFNSLMAIYLGDGIVTIAYGNSSDYDDDDMNNENYEISEITRSDFYNILKNKFGALI